MYPVPTAPPEAYSRPSKNISEHPDPLMTVPEWAAYHGLTERHVRDLIVRKRIAVARIGRTVRLRRSWGDELILQCTEPPARPLAGIGGAR
jgi:excisionase family DNA binding protein